MKGVGSIRGKANLTVKACAQVQTALLGAGKDEIMSVGGGNYPMGESHIGAVVRICSGHGLLGRAGNSIMKFEDD